MNRGDWARMLAGALLGVALVLLAAGRPPSLPEAGEKGPPGAPGSATPAMPAQAIAAAPTIAPAPDAALLPAEPAPEGAAAEFTTDFTRHTVPYGEIVAGGPPKDGIRAIDHAKFLPAAAADDWLRPQEPVILVRVGLSARAYPLQVLIWHEVVNDTVGGVPVAVTYGPLTNTGIAWLRTLGGQVLDFGATGRLRYGNPILYDRQTQTWWQQAEGAALAGALAGRALAPLPAQIISWGEFRERYPAGMVLSRDTGYRRAYGHNPYPGYDKLAQPPDLYNGPPTPGTLPPMARVLGFDGGMEAKAYPYTALAKVRVVNDSVGGQPLAVFWAPGTASALDTEDIAAGHAVGTAVAFHRRLDDLTLTFRFAGKDIVDDATGSTWSVLGTAISGPLAGRQLAPATAANHLWFSWAAFRPGTQVWGAEHR